jgi:phosphoribosylanthranilate isomerase
VDVSTGVESAPGRKDPRKVRQFVANARAAFEAEGPGPFGGSDEQPYDWADEG